MNEKQTDETAVKVDPERLEFETALSLEKQQLLVVKEALESVKTSNEQLRDRNKELATQMSSQWQRPKWAFVIVTGLAGLFFFGSIIKDIYVSSALSAQIGSLVETSSTQLQQSAEAAERGSEAAVSANEAVTGLTASVLTTLTDLAESEAELKQQIVNVKKQLTEGMHGIDQARRNGIETHTSAVEILTNLGLAREELVFRQNHQQALEYALLANNQLTISLDRLKALGEDDFALAMRKLWKPVNLMKCECYFHDENYSQVGISAEDTINEQKAVSPDDTNQTAHGYLGISYLSKYLDHEERKADLKKAVNHLSIAAGGSQPTSFISNLYLSALIVDGQHDQAQKESAAFHHEWINNSHLLPRLTKSAQANVELGISLHEICVFLNKDVRLYPEFTCQIKNGHLGLGEGKFFERVFRYLIENRGKYSDDEEIANQFGIDCAAMIVSIRRACGHENEAGSGCMGCSSGANQNRYKTLPVAEHESSPVAERVSISLANVSEAALDLFDEYGLEYRIAIPAFSGDLDLSKRIDEKRLMVYWKRNHPETNSYQVFHNGRLRNRTHTTIWSEFEVIEVPLETNQIEERRYIAYDLFESLKSKSIGIAGSFGVPDSVIELPATEESTPPVPVPMPEDT